MPGADQLAPENQVRRHPALPPLTFGVMMTHLRIDQELIGSLLAKRTVKFSALVNLDRQSITAVAAIGPSKRNQHGINGTKWSSGNKATATKREKIIFSGRLSTQWPGGRN
ncbi:predicted protein [Postia placenta Mad-698-R]|nr:predicted protein [Postia placenta Mad-698-R]